MLAVGMVQKNATQTCETCGKDFPAHQYAVNAGRARFCSLSCKSIRHGHAAGGKVSPTWHSWRSMKDRCYSPASTSYKYYGERGIEVCGRWLELFDNFLADMGERPVGTSLDRIDVNGNYEPSNCRWANPVEQRINSRNIHWIEYEGERLPMLHLAEKLGIDYSVMAKRVEAGWPAERLGEPVRVNLGVEYQGQRSDITSLAHRLGISPRTLMRRIKNGWPQSRWREPSRTQMFRTAGRCRSVP